MLKIKFRVAVSGLAAEFLDADASYNIQNKSKFNLQMYEIVFHKFVFLKFANCLPP